MGLPAGLYCRDSFLLMRGIGRRRLPSLAVSDERSPHRRPSGAATKLMDSGRSPMNALFGEIEEKVRALRLGDEDEMIGWLKMNGCHGIF